MRNLLATLLIGAVCAGGLIACGGDDNNGNPTPVINPDGSMNPPNPDGSMNPPNPDGSTGDGGSGCMFTDFVLSQAMNPTNNTQPVAFTSIPDPSCATNADFSSLFVGKP